MQATLPNSLRESTIGGMRVGDGGYTVHWAMWADNTSKLWLNPHYTVRPTAGGTTTMWVVRMRNGYEVMVNPDEKYAPGGGWTYDNCPVTSLVIRRHALSAGKAF